MARKTEINAPKFSILGNLLHGNVDLRDHLLAHVANCDPVHPSWSPEGNGKAVLALRLVCQMTGRVVLPLQRRVTRIGLTQHQLWALHWRNVHVTNLMLLPNIEGYRNVHKTGSLFSCDYFGNYGGCMCAVWQVPL